MREIGISFIILGLLASCGNKNETAEQPESNQLIEEIQVMNAKETIETVCYVCHSPTAAPDDRLAPPLEIAKRNYLAETSTRVEFVDAMVEFILRPTEEQSMLHSDVEQFGLMDPLGLSEEEIRAIAEYIYDTKLEKPDWLVDQ